MKTIKFPALLLPVVVPILTGYAMRFIISITMLGFELNETAVAAAVIVAVVFGICVGLMVLAGCLNNGDWHIEIELPWGSK